MIKITKQKNGFKVETESQKFILDTMELASLSHFHPLLQAVAHLIQETTKLSDNQVIFGSEVKNTIVKTIGDEYQQAITLIGSLEEAVDGSSVEIENF